MRKTDDELMWFLWAVDNFIIFVNLSFAFSVYLELWQARSVLVPGLPHSEPRHHS